MSAILDSNMTDMKKNIQIVKSYNPKKQQNTIIVTIPHELAKEYGFDVPQHLVMVPKNNGILIRKLNTEGIE